jgi:hypothetical protein
MEKTKFVSALTLISLLMICVSASAIFGRTASRSLFSGAGSNQLEQLGGPSTDPLPIPNIFSTNRSKSVANLGPQGFASHAPVDFNGDGKTDFVVVRNTGGGANGQLTWFYAQNGGSGSSITNFGLNSDWALTADFDGDGKSDIAIWRPGTGGTAAFYILQSSNSTLRVDQFGQTGDNALVVRDYDGDGKADPAVYRDGTPAVWYYRSSLTGNVNAVSWGTSGDLPYPGDFDGDGKSDFGIARNAGNGQLQFWRLLSTGTVMNVVQFGSTSDFMTPGDYDGDGKTDIASVTMPGGQMRWQFLSSIDGSTTTTLWGTGNDFPVQGDYDGDGKTDVAIFRRSGNPGDQAFWVHLSSTGATQVFAYGLPGDFPVAASNVY